MRIFKSISVVAVAAITLASCSSVKNLAVPTMDTVVSIPAKKGMISDEQFNHWSHADLATDTIPGMSLDKAYKFLKVRTGETVIVGVVDSGTDLKHEDLKDVAWVNLKEIPGNGIDDDKNGYIDDINGWNFLGSTYAEHLEAERILMNPKLVDVKTYNEVKAAQDIKIEKAKKNKERYEGMLEDVKNADEAFAKHLNKKDFTKEEVLAITSDDSALMKSVEIAKKMYGYGLPSLNVAITNLSKLVISQEKLLSGAKLKKNFRGVLGDNPQDISDVNYGDNVTGPSVKSESHGTHVSGIIGATRNNGIGMNGVAGNVKIMAVRAVPDGDEYDKDVALALRYAVDNGAKVINTSFGKGYSPNKQWVFDAIKYAAKHDVLIVNAAGNDGKNIDVEKTFPNDSDDLVNEISDNVLTVGAMSANYDENLPASFSNYGKINVDVFAPGVKIYSTTPEGGYAKYSGTSMAAPSAAGVAALVRSYFPKLSASQVKHILMNSGTQVNFEVLKPGSKSKENPKGEKVPFSELSVSGRIVNAYNALIMADNMVNGK